MTQTGSENTPGGAGPRLNSWKQIARYLGRDVRTVKRWEDKEVGMPVHRVPGGRSVFAYTRELDAWLVEGTPLEAPPEPYRLFGRSRLRLGLEAIAMVAIASALAGPKRSPAPEVFRLRTMGSRVLALDHAENVAWTFQHPDGRTFRPRERGPVVMVQRPEGDTLLMLPTTTEAPERTPRVMAELMAFGTGGQLRWHVVHRDSYRFARDTFSEMWVSGGVSVHDMAGRPRIAWTVHDNTWWPSALFLLDAYGGIEGPFINSGWITTTTFVKTPDGDYLLASGIRNSRQGAMLAVLDAKDIWGHSPEESGSKFTCLDCPPGGPLRYFVFPPTDVNRASGLSYNETIGVDPGDSQFQIVVREGARPSNIVWVYHFTMDFELVRIVPGDSYWPAHDLLELEGKLDHGREDCPWLAPPAILSWTLDGGWTELTASIS